MDIELRDRLGASLGRAYELERELGGAGMSRVFVARDLALGRRIVVKILPPEMAAGVNVERFHREIQLVASLTHPHILPLLNAGVTAGAAYDAGGSGLPYYTMPFIDGESLRARLTREWRLDVAEALRLAREIALALDYAHRRDVIHRDIKPENILLLDGHAIVADFGIARAISRAAAASALTSVGSFVGTPAYMSPEQASGEPEIDGRSDIYALGCVLHEMLTGSPPFTGQNTRMIIMRQITAEPPRPSATRHDVPAAVDSIVARALAKESDDRFSSGAELSQALESVQRSTPAVALAVPRTEAPPPQPSRFVAVLPFDNMSADPENEYFSDGITEEIIAHLAKIHGLRVMARTSVMRYKKTQQRAREIGRDLGVSHLLMGSVRRSQNRVRVSAQLIDAATDEHAWADTYDCDITDIFDVQSQVAQRIAERMQAPVTTGERSRLVKRPTDDPEAYNLFLLGRHHYSKVTPEDFSKALDYYRAALERDPRFARAHASIAECLMYLGLGYWGIRPHDRFPEVFKHASKALELDPATAEAHAALGMYYGWYKYDWERGGAGLGRAVELNPSAPMLRVYWAMHLTAVGRLEEALAERDAACQLDPSAMAVRGNASWLTYLARRMDAALSEGRGLRALDPDSAYGAFSHGLVSALAGPPEETVAAFRDAVRLSNGATLYLIMLAYALGISGASGEAEARSLLAEVEQRSATEFVWPMGLAMAYTHLGDKETALDYLQRAYDERVGWMQLVTREPSFDPLRGHPRFERIAKLVGPPTYTPSAG
jgi:serine/threonine-protein kinase